MKRNPHGHGRRYDEAVALEFTTSYLTDTLSLFRQYKLLAERAMAQTSDAGLYVTQHPEANSIAIIVKHIAGNMRSRWTDFLTTDGEKPDRNRDSEFDDPEPSREALLAQWEQGWTCLFAALEPLSDADLGREVHIRGEAHSVMQAINRQMAHYAYHIGQIVLLANQQNRENWQSLSVPRSKSAEFNRQVSNHERSQR